MSRETETNSFLKVKEALQGKYDAEIIHPRVSLKNLTDIFSSAHSNPKQNDFPDFIFANGCIEHFIVSSSAESNSNGSSFMKEQSNDSKEFEKYCNDEIRKIDFANQKEPVVHTFSSIKTYEGFSYQAFLKSLERNIIKHVESLKKSAYQDKTVIFLIEQQTPRMCFERDFFHAVFYEMNKDRTALKILEKCGEYVDYFVYFVNDAIEIIDMSAIKTLIMEATEHENIDGGTLISSSMKSVI